MLHNETLAVVDSYKYLGLTLDSSVFFEQHLKNMIRTIGHKLYLLTKLRRFVTQVAAERVYKTMIQPYFDHADFFYEACTNHKLEKLKKEVKNSLLYN